MTPVIRIDDEVMDELKKRAIGLGLVFEPPNATLRGIRGVDRVIRNVGAGSDQVGNFMEVHLNKIYAARKWFYIPIAGRYRKLFPGFKKDFELETDIGVITAHVSSGPRGTPIGDPVGGKRIQGGLSIWYAKHPELKDGANLRVETLVPGKSYKLSTI